MSNSMILNREELAEVVNVLWEAKSKATDDNGTFLSGPLPSAIMKLNEQLTVRFGDGSIEPVFKLEELIVEFNACDEVFGDDVSEVQINAVLDGHFRSPEVVVSIFGAGGPEAEEHPMVAQDIDGWLLAPEELIDAGLPVSVNRVLALFEPAVLKVFAERGVPIRWNPGWETETTIDPAKPDLDAILRLETR